MKTTIDIPVDMLEEVLEHTGAKTKKEAILTAVGEYNRRRRLAQLTKLFGTLDGFITTEELITQRKEG